MFFCRGEIFFDILPDDECCYISVSYGGASSISDTEFLYLGVTYILYVWSIDSRKRVSHDL